MKGFIEKVKEKIKPDEYLVLLEHFHEYNTGRITIGDLKEMVEDLLGEYPGFFYEFLSFFNFSDGLTRTTESAESSNERKEPVSEGVREIDSYNEKIRLSTSSSFQKPNPESSPRDETKDHLVQALGFCEKVMKKTSSEDYLALLKCLHDYGTGKITMVGLKMIIADYFPDFMDDFGYVLEFYTSLSRQSSESEGELTESYKFLPMHLSEVYGSWVTKLGKEVLNSCCFCKGSYGFHKNDLEIHEKMLNEKEDKLFERDMVMEWMCSTKENATKLFKAINEGEIQKPTMEDVNNQFTSYNFRFIEKMYGESGLLMVYQLRHSPETVLPVLINRLNQKEIPLLATKK